MTAHQWHLHPDIDGREPLVNELHSDIAVADEREANVLADIIGAVGHELSQPITTVSNYIAGAARALPPASPEIADSSRALSLATEQLDRIRDGMVLFREISVALHRSVSNPMLRSKEMQDNDL